MQLDLELGPDEVAVQDAVRRFCDYSLGRDDQSRRAAVFSRDLWRAYAELGVIEACHPSYPGGALQACVAMEVLGAAAFPGPAPEAVAAAAILDEEAWGAVSAGEQLVTFGTAPLVAWAGEADIVLLVDGQDVRRHEGPFEKLGTLGPTASARVDTAGQEIGAATAALARFNMAVAAYVQGAGQTALDTAAEHARTRRQFGKSLGEFQAVSFPLAEARMRLDAARIIARFAAMAIDAGRADAAAISAAARISACRAALQACFAAHQTFGASGQLVEGPVAWLSRPVQEYATQGGGLKALRAGLPMSVAAGLDLDAWAR